MPWKTHYEPRPKGKGKQAGTGTLTATYTEADGDFTLIVTESNFEPDDQSSATDFAARAKAELAVIQGAEEKMDDLLNAGTTPAT